MNKLEQILNEIREYQYRGEGKGYPTAETLSYKINLLKVMVEFFYSHVSLMDDQKKINSFLGDIKDIEKLINEYNDSYKIQKNIEEDLDTSKRVLLKNVWNCESFVLSKYDGENRNFIKKMFFEFKKYYSKEYGALLDLDNDIICLYADAPQDLHNAIMECIEKGVDSNGNSIVGWESCAWTGVGSGVLVCTMNKLDEKYNLILNVQEADCSIYITAHFKEKQPWYSNFPNNEMKELLLRFNTLWRNQLAGLA